MSFVKDQITGHCLVIAYCITRRPHFVRCPRKADPEMRIYRLYKSRTVCSFCQACSSPYIRIPDKLTCIVNNSLSGRRSPCCSFSGSLFRLFLCSFPLSGITLCLLLPCFFFSNALFFLFFCLPIRIGSFCCYIFSADPSVNLSD